MVYMLTKLWYIDGKCYHIWHTWILWATTSHSHLDARFLSPGREEAAGCSCRSERLSELPALLDFSEIGPVVRLISEKWTTRPISNSASNLVKSASNFPEILTLVLGFYV